MSTFNNYLPFTVLKLLHSNLTHLRTNADSKYEIVDVKKLPYIAKFNTEIENFLAVGDEDGWVKFFKTNKKQLTHVKELQAGKNCIYDIEWLNGRHLACGGGDHQVFVFDVTTSQRISVLGGHKESVKTIARQPDNEHVVASGARDGSILVFDTRFNRSNETPTSVRATHSVTKAHFMDTSAATTSRNVLKSKASNFAASSPHHHHHMILNNLKSSPVACLAFQSEFTLVSAGATDGFIKIWDIRKLKPPSNTSLPPPQPIHIIDQGESSATKRGFSSLVFNPSRSHIYTNGMNSQIYEHNMSTLMPEHTRAINTRHSALSGSGGQKTLNTNNTLFIKSRLSPCGQFLLTGSSDASAYIFSTSINRNAGEFRRTMPVIRLKGHDSEVTTVDWNPFDFGQCVTCSDDNTVRLWSVQHDIDEIEMGEFNFFQADLVSEEDHEEDLDTTTASTNLSLDDSLTTFINRTSSTNPNTNNTYMSFIRANGRRFGATDSISTTNIYDDLLFRSFECCGPLGRYSRPNRIMDLAEIDLAERCESITLEAEKSPPPLTRPKTDSNEPPFIQFTPTKSLLTQLPINILEINDENISEPIVVKKPPPDNILLSLLKPINNSVIPKKVKVAPRKHPNRLLDEQPLITSTSKKRTTHIVDEEKPDSVERSSKRRLIIQNDEEHTNSTKSTSQQTPKSSARTILHYFTPK